MALSSKKLTAEASKYNSYGWVAIPLSTADSKNEGKCPMLKGWQNTKLNDKISFEGAANIGIVTGKVSNIVCLDIDKCDAGTEVWESLIQKYGDVDYVPIQTTPKGGLHYIFKYEDRFEKLTSAAKKVKFNGKVVGIDFKSNGGCFVVEPSINRVNNKKYEWRNDPCDFDEIPTMPDWIFEMLLHGNLDENYNIIKKEGKIYNGGKARTFQDGEYEYVFELIDMLPDTYFTNYTQWFELGCVIYTYCDGNKDLVFQVWGDLQMKRNPDHYDEIELMDKIEEFEKNKENGGNQIGISTLEKWAKETDEDKFNEIREKYHPIASHEDFANAFRSDEGLSTMFIKHYGDNIKVINSKSKDAFIWSEKTNLWEPRSGDHIANAISPVLEERLKLVAERVEYKIGKAENETEAEKLGQVLKSINKEIKRILSTKGASDVMKKVCPKLENAEFLKEVNNKFVDLIPIKNNKVVDLKTGEVLERTRDHYFTFECPVSVETDKKKLNIVNDFMKQICNNNEELKNYLQTCLGYMLTGQTSEQCFFIWWGHGSNGKSTVVSLLNKILNVFYTPISKDVVIKNARGASSGAHTEYIVPLIQARLGIFSETEKDEKINEGLIKTMTGGESITYRPIQGKQDSFIPHFKLIIQTNNKPDIDSSQHSVVRRVKFIPFLAKFVDNPQASNEFKKDMQMAKKMENEYLDAVFTWILEGANRWYKQGLGDAPEIVNSETNKYMEELDDVSRFLADMTDIKDGLSVGVRELFRKYENWAKEDGCKAKNEREFGSCIEGKKFIKGRRGQGMKWLGIGLKQDIEECKANLSKEQLEELNK